MSRTILIFSILTATILGFGGCFAKRSGSNPGAGENVIPPVSFSGNTTSPDVKTFEIELLGCKTGRRGVYKYEWNPGLGASQPVAGGDELKLVVGDSNCYVQLRSIEFRPGQIYINRSDRREIVGDVNLFEKVDSRDSSLSVEVAATIPITAIPAAAVQISYLVSESALRSRYAEDLTIPLLKVNFTGVAVDPGTWQVTATKCVPTTVVTLAAPFRNQRLHSCEFALSQATIGGLVYQVDATIPIAEDKLTLKSGATHFKYAKIAFTAPDTLNIEILDAFDGVRFYADFDGIAGEITASAIKSGGDCTSANTAARLSFTGTLTPDRRTAFKLVGSQNALHLGEELCDFRVSKYVRRGTTQEYLSKDPLNPPFWEQGKSVAFSGDNVIVEILRDNGDADGKFRAWPNTILGFSREDGIKIESRFSMQFPLKMVPVGDDASLPTYGRNSPVQPVNLVGPNTGPFEEMQCDPRSGAPVTVYPVSMTWIPITSTLILKGDFLRCRAFKLATHLDFGAYQLWKATVMPKWDTMEPRSDRPASYKTYGRRDLYTNIEAPGGVSMPAQSLLFDFAIGDVDLTGSQLLPITIQEVIFTDPMSAIFPDSAATVLRGVAEADLSFSQVYFDQVDLATIVGANFKEINEFMQPIGLLTIKSDLVIREAELPLLNAKPKIDFLSKVRVGRNLIFRWFDNENRLFDATALTDFSRLWGNVASKLIYDLSRVSFEELAYLQTGLNPPNTELKFHPDELACNGVGKVKAIHNRCYTTIDQFAVYENAFSAKEMVHKIAGGGRATDVECKSHPALEVSLLPPNLCKVKQKATICGQIGALGVTPSIQSICNNFFDLCVWNAGSCDARP